jgi:hypothetical protein
VQDLGYVTLFASLPRPLVLAFIAAKRGKELFWAAAGYLMLLAQRSPQPLAEEVSRRPAT